MKTLNIVMLSFSFVFIARLNGTDRSIPFTRIPDRPAAANPQALRRGPQRAVGTGGCLRVVASMCCKKETVDTFLKDLGLVNSILQIGLLFAPDAVRELYLKCSNAAYVLSASAAKKIDNMGLLDVDGNLKAGWGKLVIASLQNTTGALDANDLHFHQAVIDLLARYPAIIDELRNQLSSATGISPETLTKLNSEYQLIADAGNATPEEINRIITLVATLSTPAATLTRGATFVDGVEGFGGHRSLAEEGRLGELRLVTPQEAALVLATLA